MVLSWVSRCCVLGAVLALAACNSSAPKEPSPTAEPVVAKPDEAKPAAVADGAAGEAKVVSEVNMSVDKSRPKLKPMPMKTPKKFRPLKSNRPVLKPGALKVNIKPCAADDGACLNRRLGKVVLDGWLSKGVKAEVVDAKLGKPETKSKRIKDIKTGVIFETWNWNSKGVVLDMLAADMKGPVTEVRAITVVAPFSGQTNRKVGIGSSEADVEKAYRSVLGQSNKGVVVAGDFYNGGVFFHLKAGKVETIQVKAKTK